MALGLRTRIASWVGVIVAATVLVRAHDGPPFPIVSNQTAGPYLVSIWTDPDTTDDGSAGGQFWIRLHLPGTGASVPEGTRATVTVSPSEGAGSPRTARAEPVGGDLTNQFAAVVMDHEGRFAVKVDIRGTLGAAHVESAVDATYDLRPAPALLALYLAPFLLVGLLWGRLIVRRRTENLR